MKKIFCILLALALILGTFSGCNKQDSTGTTGTTQTESTETTTQTESTKATQLENTKTNQTETEQDISSLPLEEAYHLATKAYADDTQSHRSVGQLQPETTQIVEIDGKYYQSFVASNVDHRYIWISEAEFPDSNQATWDWYIAGSANVYSLESLSRPNAQGTNPYPTLEVTDSRVKTENNQKVFDSYPYFSVAFPADWKCYIRQGEDGSNYYFKDPTLGDKCRLAVGLAESWTAKDRTEEEYRKIYPSYHLESLTTETIDGLQGQKVVYTYTSDNTEYVTIHYNNYVDNLRAFSLSIVYPAAQKDVYEPIFAAMIESTVLYRYAL